jgi:hypothetical protein
VILYTATALASPEPTTYTIPQGMGGVAFQNITSWSWQVTDAHGGDFTILPFSNATIPGSSGETFYVTPLAQTEALTINVPIQVSIAYLKTAPASFSQTSQLPVYTMSADVSVDTSGGPVDIEGTVTANISGPVDIQAASGVNIPVEGNVNATIDTSGGPVDVQATIAAGQAVNVATASGVTLPIAAPSAGLPVTTGTGGLSMEVNNVVDIQAASGVTIPVSGDVTATIDTSGGAVDIEGTVTANISGPVNIQAASGVTIPVNGTVDVGTINETVSTDSNVTNVKLSTNNLVALGSATISNQTWDANQKISFQFNDVAPLVLADELWMAFSDTASLLSNLELSFSGLVYWPVADFNETFTTTPTLVSNNTNFRLWKVPIVPSYPINGCGYNLQNTSSSAITDTITVYAWARYASSEVVNTTTNPVNAVAPPNDVQDASGSITAGGTAQTVLASNANRRFLSIVNPGNENGDTIWVNFGSDASAGAGSYPLGPGIGLFFPQGQFVPSSSVSLYAATTGDTFTVKYA